MPTKITTPLRRLVKGNGKPDELVVELHETFVVLRPKRVRNPNAQAAITWGQIYDRALTLKAWDGSKANGEKPKPRKRVKRGLLQ